MAVPDAMKLEFILAEEQYILSQASLLEQLHNLQPYLDSEHIKAVPAQASKLQALTQLHIKQQDQSDEVTEETKRLLEDYNKLVSFIPGRARGGRGGPGNALCRPVKTTATDTRAETGRHGDARTGAETHRHAETDARTQTLGRRRTQTLIETHGRRLA
uniref:Uncharacterized protein n=1 Tax=Leptobrachium leishanense TaxID=445787 RepID=A0A8C5PSS2_9ANUR